MVDDELLISESKFVWKWCKDLIPAGIKSIIKPKANTNL